MVVLHPVTIVAGTPIPIALASDVPSGSEPGTPLKFRALQDIRITGSIVIPQGAEVKGELLAAGKRVVVFGGKTQFKLTSVTAIDGKKLTIKASPGAKNEQSIEPKGFKSKELIAPSGAQYMAYIDGDQSVSVKR